jgi:glucose-1-phosphate cytidylyltransferase
VRPSAAHQETPVIVLCGGRGSRMGQDTTVVPKPMLQIGGSPVLWHIMQIFGSQGHGRFVLALGWQGYLIKQWILNLDLMSADFELDVGRREARVLHPNRDMSGWRVTCLDTGETAGTGARVRRVFERLDCERAFLAYGDCVGNVDLTRLFDFHCGHRRAATVTAVHAPVPWGELEFGPHDSVTGFYEKQSSRERNVNGGFMVLERRALTGFNGDDLSLEQDVLPKLAAEGELAAFQHHGFWAPMDTPADRAALQRLWNSGSAPWLASTDNFAQ